MPEGARGQRFGSTIRHGVVAVEIGRERVKHFVHKALLEQHSEYFRKALNGSWMEAKERIVSLDDVECSAFEVFVEWLYTRKLPDESHEWVEDEYQKDQHVCWHTAVQTAMIKAYAFAGRMLSPILHHALESKLIDYFITNEGLPYYGTIIYAFAHLQSTSPVLKAMIDAHCRDFDEPGDTEENGESKLRTQLPNTFLVGVMIRYANTQGKRKVKLDQCDYHDHTMEGEREICQRVAQKLASDRSKKEKEIDRARRTARSDMGVMSIDLTSSGSSSSRSESESSIESSSSDSDSSDSD